jgi:hypothetical protein
LARLARPARKAKATALFPWKSLMNSSTMRGIRAGKITRYACITPWLAVTVTVLTSQRFKYDTGEHLSWI